MVPIAVPGLTPRQTVLAMFQAVEAGEERTFLACWKASESRKKLLRRVFACWHETAVFRRALAKAYGEVAYRRLRFVTYPDESSVWGDSSYSVPATPAEVAESLRVEEKDGALVCRGPSYADMLKVVKEGGQWLLVPRYLPSEDDEDSAKEKALFCDLLARVLREIRRVKPMIGKSGISVADILRELERRKCKFEEPD